MSSTPHSQESIRQDLELKHQASFPDLCPITEATQVLSLTGGVEARGAVFTRREVVDFLLDLAGYSADEPLHIRRFLEPSFGRGDFLLPAIERLLAAWKSHGEAGEPHSVLAGCIRAVELHRDTFHQTRTRVIDLLLSNGFDAELAVQLADEWLVAGDFLMVALPGQFDAVVGNPPYVRQELIPDALLSAYRDRYSTMYDRADLYVPFIERSLRLLGRDGRLSFICADRWMKNRYGGPLRKLVADHFHLRIYVDMVDTPAFHSEVSAYPAITVIERGVTGPTRVALRPSVDRDSLQILARHLLSAHAPEKASSVSTLDKVVRDSDPWILDTSDQLALVRRLEESFPTIEDAACKVGIGVATGADQEFIGPLHELDVEDDRKLPIAMTRDIQDGTVKWRGLGVINPFCDGSGLVDLNEYPRLKRYLEDRKDKIASRHCAQKLPANWYRTIDRITPSLAKKPKLLVPDIKGSAHIVYEDGNLYPHHNLYYVTSDTWDLRALQAVLLSSVTQLFIATYSTKMRGGFLRFQAQYLRRLRLPVWDSVPDSIREDLIHAAKSFDLAACDRGTFDLYGLTTEEIAALGGARDN